MRYPIQAWPEISEEDFDLSDPQWDWSWHEFDFDSSSETFGPFAPIVDVWRSGGPGVPNWKKFEFTDFRGWHGRINLLELISDDPVEFRIRLMGTTFVALFGEECTGRRVESGVGGFEDDDVEVLKRFIDGPSIGRCGGQIDWNDRNHVVVDLIYLPVSSDGHRVDRIMECGYFPGVRS